MWKVKKTCTGFKVGDELNVIGETNSFLTVNKPDGNVALVPKSLCEQVEHKSNLLDSLFCSFEDAKSKEPVTVGPYQVLLSTVTRGRLPKSGVDHVIDVYPPETFPEEVRCDIPDVDGTYWWDPDLLESMAISHKLNKKILLTGFPGTGKTTAVAQYGAIVQQPVMRFNGKDGIDPSSFLGNIWASSSGMEWKDGLLPQGLKLGYLVTIDEVFKIPAGVQMSLQSLYEDNGHLTLDDKPGTLLDKRVYPDTNFRLFVTDNVKGTGDDYDKFSGTQVQDSSTLDRFSITAQVNYLPKYQEIEMLKAKFPNIDATPLVTFAGLIRDLYAKGEVSITVSPRGLQTVCEIVSLGVPESSAIEMSILNKFPDGAERDAVIECIKVVYK